MSVDRQLTSVLDSTVKALTVVAIDHTITAGVVTGRPSRSLCHASCVRPTYSAPDQTARRSR
jgi:hypothetical protein